VYRADLPTFDERMAPSGVPKINRDDAISTFLASRV